jgi:uncharacterized membrane protein
MNKKNATSQNRIFSRLKKWFISGLILWIPLITTFYIFQFIITHLDNIFRALPQRYRPNYILGNIIPWLQGYHIPGLGVIICLIILLLTGMLITNYIGRNLISLTEKKLVEKIPLVRTIYKAIKQISNAVLSDSNKSFQSVVLIEYPRKGCYSLAFQTSEPFLDASTNRNLITVFVPTTPNPTSGFVLLVPAEEATNVHMPVEEALRFIISLGVVTPDQFANTTKELKTNNKET